MDNISYGDFVFCGLYDFFGSVFSKRTAKLDAAHAVGGEFFRRCAGFFEIGYADDLRRLAAESWGYTNSPKMRYANFILILPFL